MIRLLIVVIFTFILIPFQKDPYYTKQGIPSTYGINQYIKNNQESLIKEFEYYIGDTLLYDVYLFTDDLEQYTPDGLGEFYPPDQIYITNKERFVEYEFKQLSKFKQRTLPHTSRTVKAVVFHELTHAYFTQILNIMKMNGYSIPNEYLSFRIIPNPTTRFGTDFIEEGICEYMIYHLNECPPLTNIPIPYNMEELLNEDNKVNILYGYSVYFLKNFMDEYALKESVQILIQNKPPTYDEILKPELFFNRLQKTL